MFLELCTSFFVKSGLHRRFDAQILHYVTSESRLPGHKVPCAQHRRYLLLNDPVDRRATRRRVANCLCCAERSAITESSM